MFEEVMLDISVVSWPPSGFSWTPASVSWNDWLPPVPEFSDLRHTMRNKGKQFGGSKYGVKTVEPLANMYSPYGAILKAKQEEPYE